MKLKHRETVAPDAPSLQRHPIEAFGIVNGNRSPALEQNCMKPKKSDQAWSREKSRRNRNAYTDVLKAHGVRDRGYMLCTDGIYQEALGGRAYEVRAANDLGAKANLRDHLCPVDLMLVSLAEAVAAERIEGEGSYGNAACAAVSRSCARAIAAGIRAARAPAARK